MKIRNGFVSNSSTSSFLIYGIKFYEGDVKEFFLNSSNNEAIRIRAKRLLEDDEDIFSFMDGVCTEILLNQFELYYVDELELYYVGKSWGEIKDDETGSEFKKNIENELKKAFGDNVEISTHTHAWYDG